MAVTRKPASGFVALVSTAAPLLPACASHLFERKARLCLRFALCGYTSETIRRISKPTRCQLTASCSLSSGQILNASFNVSTSSTRIAHARRVASETSSTASGTSTSCAFETCLKSFVCLDERPEVEILLDYVLGSPHLGTLRELHAGQDVVDFPTSFRDRLNRFTVRL